MVLCINPDTLRVAARLDDRAQMRPQYARDSGQNNAKSILQFYGPGKAPLTNYSNNSPCSRAGVAAWLHQQPKPSRTTADAHLFARVRDSALLSEVFDFEHEQTC